MGTMARVRLSLAAVVLALSGFAIVGSATPAQAHDSTSNGCSNSPDSSYFPVYYNFHGACDRHDYCYHYHYYGDGYYGRLGCDSEFLGNMRNSCYNRYPHWYQVGTRYTCYGVASTYYTAVRAFGGSHF